MKKKLMVGLVTLALAAVAICPVAFASDKAVDTTVADNDAKKEKVEVTTPRVDYVSNVVYKQITTGNSNTSLRLNMLLPKLADEAPAPVVMFVKGSGFTAMNLDGFMEQRMPKS